MPKDKPRYSRVSDIIDLAVFMQSKANGISIKDIEKRYNVSRRTAIRMRDSLMNIFPSIVEFETKVLQKHWGFYNYSINELITFTSKEIAALEQIKRITVNQDIKNELQKIIEKLKAFSKKKLPKIENRVDLILQTEGYAIRQMPQYKINTEVLNTIRTALQNSIKVTGIYHDKERLLEPLGIIYGEKIYLAAREKAKGDEIYTYILHKFNDIKLTDETFDKLGFDLNQYSKRSFGVYQGEILNVKLNFDNEVIDDVLSYNFHPTQKIKKETDGTITVQFKASGIKEIIWHIFKWGKHCKIIAPKKLKDKYRTYLQELL